MKTLTNSRRRINHGQASSLKNGRRFIVGDFSVSEGKTLPGVIDRRGRVWKVHPYDIPKEPMKVLAFALNHTLMMIDTGQLKVSPNGPFLTEAESTHYRELTLDLLRDIECEEVIGERIEYQEIVLA